MFDRVTKHNILKPACLVMQIVLHILNLCLYYFTETVKHKLFLTLL